MITKKVNRTKKTVSRAFAISTLLGIALAAGSATAASASPVAHPTVKTAAAQPTGGHDHGGGQTCIIVLLCN